MKPALTHSMKWKMDRLNKRIEGCALAGLGMLVGSLGTLSQSMAGERSGPPNLVFMMADDIGYNDWACYGQTIYPTPNTDKLANEGVRLTSAYSPSPVCTPTRYSVLTGTDPCRRFVTSHVIFNAEPLLIGIDEGTVASLLKRGGYTTGVVGKWHVGLGDSLPRDLNKPGRGPNEIGFDYSFLVPDGNNMLPHVYHENGAVLGGTEPPFKPNLKAIERISFLLLEHQRRGDWAERRPGEEIGATLADRVDAFIDNHAERPFFLYYATCTVHSPHTPDKRFEGKSGYGRFADFVMEFDWAVGRVMTKLDELGLADNTLLIVTSDNGGLTPRETKIPEKIHRTTDPWRGYKGDAYEGGYRIPLLARWPGKIKPGSVSDTYISLVDLMATAANLAGVELPETAALDSYDMLPALRGEEAGRPYVVMATRGMTAISIREGDWKLIHWPGSGRSELYHLGRDPRETEDLFGAEPEQAFRLQTLLETHFTEGSSRHGARAEGRPLSSILAEKEERNELVTKIAGLAGLEISEKLPAAAATSRINQNRKE